MPGAISRHPLWCGAVFVQWMLSLGKAGAWAGNQIVLHASREAGRKHLLMAANAALAAPVLHVCGSTAPSAGTHWPSPRMFNPGAINPLPNGKISPPLSDHMLISMFPCLALQTRAHEVSKTPCSSCRYLVAKSHLWDITPGTRTPTTIDSS